MHLMNSDIKNKTFLPDTRHLMNQSHIDKQKNIQPGRAVANVSMLGGRPAEALDM